MDLISRNTALNNCVMDLEDYYATCGTEKDFLNLKVLKDFVLKYQNEIDVNEIEVDFEVIEPPKKNRNADAFEETQTTAFRFGLP